MELVFKFSSPYRLSTSAVSQRISRLYHEAFNDPVKNEIIIIAITAVRCEILHSFWALFWVQSHMNITHCGVKDLVK